MGKITNVRTRIHVHYELTSPWTQTLVADQSEVILAFAIPQQDVPESAILTMGTGDDETPSLIHLVGEPMTRDRWFRLQQPVLADLLGRLGPRLGPYREIEDNPERALLLLREYKELLEWGPSIRLLRAILVPPGVRLWGRVTHQGKDIAGVRVHITALRSRDVP